MITKKTASYFCTIIIIFSLSFIFHVHNQNDLYSSINKNYSKSNFKNNKNSPTAYPNRFSKVSFLKYCIICLMNSNFFYLSKSSAFLSLIIPHYYLNISIILLPIISFIDLKFSRSPPLFS